MDRVVEAGEGRRYCLEMTADHIRGGIGPKGYYRRDFPYGESAKKSRLGMSLISLYPKIHDWRHEIFLL